MLLEFDVLVADYSYTDEPMGELCMNSHLYIYVDKTKESEIRYKTK